MALNFHEMIFVSEFVFTLYPFYTNTVFELKFFFVCLVGFCFFKTEFCCAVLAVLELVL